MPALAPQLDLWSPTDDDLLDLKVRRRQDRIRFSLFRRDEYAGEIHPRADQTVKIDNDTTRSVNRTMSGFELLPSDAAEINVLSDRVDVDVLLENGSVRHVGTFLWGNASTTVRGWGRHLSSSLVDETFGLDQPIGRTYGLRAGDPIQLRAVALAREVLPHLLAFVDPGVTIARSPVSWTPQDTRRKILDDMMKLCGWLPMYIGNQHTLVFRAAPTDLDSATPAVRYDVDGHIIADSIVETDDWLSAPNRWVVIASDGQGPPIVGWYNVPAEYPHSRASRGFHITVTETLQGIESGAAARAAARRLAATTNAAYRWVDFSSTLDPRHDTWDIVSWFGVPYLEVAWSMELLSGGVMTHRLRRVV